MRVPSDNRLAMKRLRVSRSGMRSSLLLFAPTKACSINPHAMENHGDLASHRNLGALHAPPLGNSQAPSLECCEPRRPRQQGIRCFIEHGTNHRIPAPRYASDHVSLARLVPFRVPDRGSGNPTPLGGWDRGASGVDWLDGKRTSLAEHLWARGYWVVTSGNVTDEMWADYIKNQTPPEPDDNFNVT
jgi:REP element-mobilizing transposase RayT